MNEKTIVPGVILAAFALLGILNGALPWAIGGGVVMSGLAWFISHEWKTTLSVGGFVAVLILAMGAVSAIMPGWHQGLIDALRI